MAAKTWSAVGCSDGCKLLMNRASALVANNMSLAPRRRCRSQSCATGRSGSAPERLCESVHSNTDSGGSVDRPGSAGTSDLPGDGRPARSAAGGGLTSAVGGDVLAVAAVAGVAEPARAVAGQVDEHRVAVFGGAQSQ